MIFCNTTNCDVKQGLHSKPPTPNQAQMKQPALSHLHKLQKLPQRIIKYFEHPFIAYAAYKNAISMYCLVNTLHRLKILNHL